MRIESHHVEVENDGGLAESKAGETKIDSCLVHHS
jgi:hypothetical protein